MAFPGPSVQRIAKAVRTKRTIDECFRDDLSNLRYSIKLRRKDDARRYLLEAQNMLAKVSDLGLKKDYYYCRRRYKHIWG